MKIELTEEEKKWDVESKSLLKQSQILSSKMFNSVMKRREEFLQQYVGKYYQFDRCMDIRTQHTQPIYIRYDKVQHGQLLGIEIESDASHFIIRSIVTDDPKEMKEITVDEFNKVILPLLQYVEGSTKITTKEENPK